MGFETVVLDKVAAVLKQDRQAYFAYGTLFVECDEYQAREIGHKLTNFQGLPGVKISKVGDEFAYDFVA